MKITTEIKTDIKLVAKAIEEELLFGSLEMDPSQAIDTTLVCTKAILESLKHDDINLAKVGIANTTCFNLFMDKFGDLFPDYIRDMNLDIQTAMQNCIAERLSQRFFNLNNKKKLSSASLATAFKFQHVFSNNLLELTSSNKWELHMFHESEHALVTKHMKKFFVKEELNLDSQLESLFDEVEESEEVEVKTPQPFKKSKPQSNVVLAPEDIIGNEDMSKDILLDELTYVTKGSRSKYAAKQAAKAKKAIHIDEDLI